MSEPTKEQIADFEKLADSFGLDCGGYWQFSGKEIAAFIQYIRAKERNDALELAVVAVESLWSPPMGVVGEACNDVLHRGAELIRGKKVPT